MPKTRLNFLITAGPTIEPIDPVRFLSNRSSGKMGYALARAAKAAGHNVTLVSGPTKLPPPPDCLVIVVQTARDMRKEVLRYFQKSDIIIKTAAVADYRPEKSSSKKIKKQDGPLLLRLVLNPDILEELGRKKRSHQILVGFAAETNNFVRNAKRKINKKNLDWIVLNDVSKKEIGFGSNNNAATLISKDGKIKKFKKQDKSKLASTLLRTILR